MIAYIKQDHKSLGTLSYMLKSGNNFSEVEIVTVVQLSHYRAGNNKNLINTYQFL